MNIKLLGNRVLIEADNEEKKTASGLVIKKEEEMGDYSTGTVAHVGEGKMNDRGELLPMGVKINDKVIFQYGKAVQVEGKTYLIVMEEDIIMVF